jgi:hypothetical protein
LPVFLDPIVSRINRGRQLPTQADVSRPFKVFSLGRVAAITDNGASKAALSG